MPLTPIPCTTTPYGVLVTIDRRGPGASEIAAILVRAGVLALIVLGIVLVISSVRNVLQALTLAALLVLMLLCGTVLGWATRDARRGPGPATVLARWSAVTAIASAGYVIAAFIAAGTYVDGIPLSSLVGQAALVAGVLVAVPAAIGTLVGSLGRRVDRRPSSRANG